MGKYILKFIYFFKKISINTAKWWWILPWKLFYHSYLASSHQYEHFDVHWEPKYRILMKLASLKDIFSLLFFCTLQQEIFEIQIIMRPPCSQMCTCDKYLVLEYLNKHIWKVKANGKTERLFDNTIFIILCVFLALSMCYSSYFMHKTARFTDFPTCLINDIKF